MIKGFKVKDVVEKYDYNSLENAPCIIDNVGNVIFEKDVLLDGNKSIRDAINNIDNIEENVDIHIENKDNPHKVTCEQIGAESAGAAQEKSDEALENAKSYTDEIVVTINEAIANRYTKAEADNKVNIFHASIDNSNFQYVKGSADFTYEDVMNTENCQIEVSVANEKVYLKKQEFKNINPPDSIAGRYVVFSEIIRVASEMAELFLFVYDPENLPTDEENANRLENWGNYQYCVSSYQSIVMGNFLVQDVNTNRNVNNNAPSVKSSADYTDERCGVVLNYMQTEFAQNIINMCEDKYGAHVIYKNAEGFEASNSDVGKTWHLTGLDLSPYKRLKFYVKSSGSNNDNFTPAHVVEMHLGNNSVGYENVFVAGHMSQNPNNANRIHCVTFAVNYEKTSIQFVRATSLYGTASTDALGGRVCYLIEGYKV
jgi:hypothetical protein